MGDLGGEANPHPDVLQNEYPSIVSTIFSTGATIITSYGWFLLVGVIALFYLKTRYQSRINQWQKSREEQDHKKYDTGTAQARLEAMERSRQRMQAQLDEQAVAYAEKQKQKEEEKRRQKIEDWDRHLEGKGYRNKYKPEDEQTNASGSLQKPKPKKPLRPNDYNPLTGGAGGNFFRPARRSGTGGG